MQNKFMERKRFFSKNPERKPTNKQTETCEKRLGIRRQMHNEAPMTNKDPKFHQKKARTKAKCRDFFR